MPLEYGFVEDLDPAEAAIFLRRGHLDSDYFFDLLLTRVYIEQSLFSHFDDAQLPEITLLFEATRERYCSTYFFGDKKSLIVCDIGFFELIADYQAVYFDLCGYVLADQQWPCTWCDPVPVTRLEQLEETRKRIEAELGYPDDPGSKTIGEVVDGFLDIEERIHGDKFDREEVPDIVRAISEKAAARLGRFKHPPPGEDAREVPGSMIFRDLACKLIDAALGEHRDNTVLEAFMLWLLEHNGQQYQPGAFANNFFSRADRLDEDLVQVQKQMHAKACASVILHEIAHALNPDFSFDVWMRSNELYAASALLLQYAKNLARFESTPIISAMRNLFHRHELDLKTRRSVSESFFDIHAFRMYITYVNSIQRPDLCESEFRFTLQVFCSTISIVVLRNTMSRSLEDHAFLKADATEALEEAAARCLILAADAQLNFAQFFPGYPVDFIAFVDDIFAKVEILSHYFRIDVLNGMPSAGYFGESREEWEPRAWRELIALSTH